MYDGSCDVSRDLRNAASRSKQLICASLVEFSIYQGEMISKHPLHDLPPPRSPCPLPDFKEFHLSNAAEMPTTEYEFSKDTFD